MPDHGFGNGITTLFSQALAENAAAMEIFDAMTAEDKQKVLKKAAGIERMDEMKKYIDSLVGWKIGHAPYQL